MRRRTMIAAGLAVAATGRARAAETPVVLELFTSQGCSSCPPADALLGELSRQPNVIALAFHVDYWNRLGWPDPFASRAWTGRQRLYARALGTEVYTPALVVNGTTMVVGSHRQAVAQAMREAAELTLDLSLRRSAAGLQARIGGELPADAEISLAAIDVEQVTKVGAGENGGRVLREFRIVRALHVLDASGPLDRLPAVPGHQAAVLLARDARGRVIGAAAVDPV